MADIVSIMTLFIPLTGKTAIEIAKHIVKEIKQINVPIFAVTFDSRIVFSEYNIFPKQLIIEVYFTDPYGSFLIGIYENTKGLIRQYFPKRNGFRTLSINELIEAKPELNNRPRKE